MPMLTVYTPTYNRAHLLPRVYASLLGQTCRDFIWLVIDDGSTDGTRELVEEWIEDAELSIRYVYKENGGVHTARDLAYRLCETELITSIDSDDWLTDSAVEQWLKCWNEKARTRHAGIISVVIDESGRRVTDVFPPVQETTYQDYTYRYKCGKEKHTLLRTDIIKGVQRSPVFANERLVGEGYKWIQLPENKTFILLDTPTRVYQKQGDGYIRNVATSRFENPNGFRESCRQHIINARYLRPRIKGHIGYIAFSIILRDKHLVQSSPRPFVTALLLPVGVAAYMRFVIQRRATEHE